MEINGFEIDKYNQYGLPENVKRSTCPLCSESRKNKTEKVLSLNWQSGLGYCHHCGATIQLHTFKSKSETKQYVRPNKINTTDLSDKLVKWFDSRGISQDTLKKMRISEGVEWMPVHEKEINTVQFNYFLNGEIVNIKYRSADKKFKMYKDAERILYNIDAIRLTSECVIVEGEMDALSFIECGIENVVSVPNGATKGHPNLDFLEGYIEYFENKEKIILCLDNDEAGQTIQKELIRRLGAARCYTIDLADCKDANEFLVKYGTPELKLRYNEPKEIPLEGVSSVNDWRDSFEDYLINGMKQGYTTGIKPFNDRHPLHTLAYSHFFKCVL